MNSYLILKCSFLPHVWAVFTRDHCFDICYCHQKQKIVFFYIQSQQSLKNNRSYVLLYYQHLKLVRLVLALSMLVAQFGINNQYDYQTSHYRLKKKLIYFYVMSYNQNVCCSPFSWRESCDICPCENSSISPQCNTLWFGDRRQYQNLSMGEKVRWIQIRICMLCAVQVIVWLFSCNLLFTVLIMIHSNQILQFFFSTSRSTAL